MAKSSLTTKTMIRKEAYAHSPIHLAVILGDHKTLTRLISALPKFADPSAIHTESDSLTQESVADQISSVLDRRDVPRGETPLHLAVRLNDSFSARALAAAGADVSLQNGAGWNPLQECVCVWRNAEIGVILLRSYHRSAWSKWRRRLPRLVAVLGRMRDFYMEISFHFESSVIPFVGKMAPSDTYKIWKREGNLRADTSLAGFDGLKIQRSDQSFLFLGDGDGKGNPDLNHHLPSGSLLVLNHDHKKIFNAFENNNNNNNNAAASSSSSGGGGGCLTESDISEFWSQKSVYRPGMDVTKAQLVGRTNWRRQEKTESVGEWKAKVFDVHNVFFSFRSRKVSSRNHNHMMMNMPTSGGGGGDDAPCELELDEDAEEGFLVAENPRYSFSSSSSSTSNANANGRRHSSFVRQDREFISMGRKSFDVKPLSAAAAAAAAATAPSVVPLPEEYNNINDNTKEKEYTKSLRPSVWLTEEFPLKTEELLPLLDILANKVKAVRRLRELLTTKFPPGSFPVKVAIPVVPTVRVVVTFTKFVELQRVEHFYTPLSSPTHFLQATGDDVEQQQQQPAENRCSSSSAPAWLRRTNSHLGSKQNQMHKAAHQVDPFSIPSDYAWASITADKPPKTRMMNKSSSTRKAK